MEMKKLKQEMQSLFATIQESTQLGELPSLQETAQFERLARRLLTMASEDWMDECEDFVHIVDQLHKSVKQGQASDAILLVESIADAKTFCHRTYGSDSLE